MHITYKFPQQSQMFKKNTTFLNSKSSSQNTFHKYNLLKPNMLTKNKPRIINQHYEIFDTILLGKGSTGNVFEGRQLTTGRKVAIKVIELTKIDNEVTQYLLNCEITALNNMGRSTNTQHTNIVQLLDTVHHKDFIYLIMELLEGGTLMEYMKRYPNGLPVQIAQNIFRQLVEAYRYIHSKGVIHRDLKPSNILFKNKPEINKQVAIIDFGYCEMKEVPNKPQMYYNVGSPKYMSPEAYQSNIYSEKSDIWALGVIFYEMLMGRTCDHGMDMKEYLTAVEKKGINFHKPVSPFHRFLISNMLQFDHHARFDCLQLIITLKQHDTVFNRPNSTPIKRNSNDKNKQSTKKLSSFNPQVRNLPVFRSMIVDPSKLEEYHQRVNFIGKQIRTSLNIPQKKQENNVDKKMGNFASRLPFAVNQLQISTQGLQLIKPKRNPISLDYNSQNNNFQNQIHQLNILNLPHNTSQFYPNDKQNQKMFNYTQFIKANVVPRHSDHLPKPPLQKVSFNIIQPYKNQPLQKVKIDATPHQNHLLPNRQRISTVPLHLQKYNDNLNSITIDQIFHEPLITRQVFYSLDKKTIPLQNQSNYIERNILPSPKSVQISIKKKGPIKNRKPGLSTPIRAEFSNLPPRSQRPPETSKACPIL